MADPSIGQELLNTPFPEMVEKLGLAVATAQTALDNNSIAIAKEMANIYVDMPNAEDPTKTIRMPLYAMGLTPRFYEFQESIIEVKIAISMAKSSETSVGGSVKVGWGPVAASVNASYSQKYSYNVEGSSLLRCRLVPVPPPSALQSYLETMIDNLKKDGSSEGGN